MSRNIFCASIKYLLFTIESCCFFKGINASSLSLTAFTVERYIAICHPMKAQRVCTVKRAKKIIVGVWIFAFCYSAPWLGLTTTDPIIYKGHQTVEMCTFKLSRKEYLVCSSSILSNRYYRPTIYSSSIILKSEKVYF